MANTAFLSDGGVPSSDISHSKVGTGNQGQLAFRTGKVGAYFGSEISQSRE